jgi:hypothetical protein
LKDAFKSLKVFWSEKRHFELLVSLQVVLPNILVNVWLQDQDIDQFWIDCEKNLKITNFDTILHSATSTQCD